MKRATWAILLGLSFLLVVLVIGTSMWLKIKDTSENIPLQMDIRERTDIIVSDQLPMGCFIPPVTSEAKFNSIFNNNDLKETCLKYDKMDYIGWDDISDRLKHGIKLNGHCYNCNMCLCLERKIPGWEDIITESRSINLGCEYKPETKEKLKSKCGNGICESDEDLQNCVEDCLVELPSIFVVKKGEAPKLALYSGIFMRERKSVEKVTAALYNNTFSEENRISEIVGEHRSCYYGDGNEEIEEENGEENIEENAPKSGKENGAKKGNWVCYSNCRGSKSQEECRVECNCYVDQRYYSEDSTTICDNYCAMDFEGNESDCKIGCGQGEKRKCYRECIINTPNIKYCESEVKCDCDYCNETFDEYAIANNILCREDSRITNDDIKTGCEKFIEIENSYFQVNPMEYNIFKVGDVELDSAYRGLAFAVATITTREKHPGDSCYNPNKYNCYAQCCDELCDNAEICCGNLDKKCKSEGIGKNKCGKRCNCSIDHRINSSEDNPFVLCETFCASRDGYYGDDEKANRCRLGCDWAYQSYYKPEFISFQKNVDLVFVVDTSGSMCQSDSDEWGSLCKIIGDLSTSIEEEDYKVNVTIYALGENGEVGGCKTNCASTCMEPNCRYKILDCSDMNSDLELSLKCTAGACYTESWGPGAEWAVKNHPWGEEILSKILFVVGDEGPYCGVPIENNDKTSVERAAQAAIENNVTIFGLWGIGIGGDIIDLFKKISESTKGSATKFDTADPDEVTKLITDAIIKDIEFETGYDKFQELIENTIPLESPYIWKEVYDEVFSNLIYIVDWDATGTSEWGFPLENNDWTKVNTPLLEKSVTYHSVLEEIKSTFIG
ncbi:MAG: hypothetical protein KAU95_02215 [Candidatus Aenigmarchaeota archaeon]|nr:hypothetical protein [Candidatus Aenigmarchaeota archaeon]